jgi:hypothetical protein
MQYDEARAMAYEVNRRLSSRDGFIAFSREEKEERKKDGIDGRYDRYNRVLEGVVQILNRADYPNVFCKSLGI